MLYYLNFLKVYFYYLSLVIVFFFIISFDYYSKFMYNYILYLHIAFIFISYILFFVLFFIYISYIYSSNFIKTNISSIGVFSTFYTLFVGIIWGYSIWKTFTIFDLRILFIFILFLYFIFDYFSPLFNFKYKTFLYFIMFIHFFILKIKINWTSQIHQSNSFFNFFSHLPLLDIFFFLLLFICVFTYFLYIQCIKEYAYSLKNNIAKNFN